MVQERNFQGKGKYNLPNYNSGMMKVFSYSLVFSAVYAALIEPRAAQFGGLGSLFGKGSKDNASGKPIKIENVKPRIRSSAKRQLIRYGPVKLAASKVVSLALPNRHFSYRGH
jgi:hypothetical protein